MSHNIINLIGKRFTNLIVIARSGSDTFRQAMWLCQCDCGNQVIVIGANLRKGNTKSCGCRKAIQPNAFKHGHKRNSIERSKEYTAWVNMIQRCTNPNSTYYYNYGGRGILVCDQWKKSFQNFFKDMGKAPSNRHSIDRIDNDGNYEPGNCRWATWKQQANNKKRKTSVNG